MSRVRTLAAAAVASILSASFAATPADANSVKVGGRPVAVRTIDVADATPARTSGKDADDALTRGDKARMRAERALEENGERAKVEDEAVIENETQNAPAANGEAVKVQRTSKTVCVAGCN